MTTINIKYTVSPHSNDDLGSIKTNDTQRARKSLPFGVSGVRNEPLPTKIPPDPNDVKARAWTKPLDVASRFAAPPSAEVLTTSASPQASAANTKPREPVKTGPFRFKSLFTAKNINRAVRVAAVGIAVATLFSSVAVLAGAALGPWLIVVAVGFGIGALAGLLAHHISRYFAKTAGYLAENASGNTIKKSALKSTSLVTTYLYNASERGTVISLKIAGCLASLNAGSGCAKWLMAINEACAKAIGLMNNMRFEKPNLVKESSAGLATMVSCTVAWSLGVSERNFGKIAHAVASSTDSWASRGHLIDDFIFTLPWLGILRRLENEYFNMSKSWFSLPTRPEEPAAGIVESLAALSGGTLGGLTAAVDIHTQGEITRIGEAVDTARQTVSFGKLLNAARNDLDMRPGGTLNAVHTAWQTVSFGKLVSAVCNYFELRIPHPA